MTVRLEAPPVSAPDGTVVSAPGVHDVPLAAPLSAARAEQSSRRDLPIVEARPVPEASALPVAHDPHYYAARDLDSFPWPLAPLQLEHLAGVRSGEVHLELLIDELGIVREVLFVGRARPDLEDGELHAALTTAQFVPARKDGRAVKSRVWMSIRYDANSQ